LGSDEREVGEPQIDNINPFVPRPIQGLVRWDMDEYGQVVDGAGILLAYAFRYARQVVAKIIRTLLQGSHSGDACVDCRTAIRT